MNNYAKTVQLLARFGKKTLFISTDKAVEPASFYGRTKMIGEQFTREVGGIVARLGNILGSSGSVIPKWEAAISRGEPLPITDPAMTRYLIPAEEAVKKILQLLPQAVPGDTIIPEMGEAKPLLAIADEVLARHGMSLDSYTPGTVTIGRRPGEKQHEKLYWDDEKVIVRSTDGIIVRR